MTYATMPLGTLTPLDRNPRKHTPTQLKELVRSIEKFGQIRPIVVDENNMVLAGNGLLAALTSMGRADGEVLKMTGLSEHDKMRLALADNKIASLGVDDYAVIEDLLMELSDELDVPGFDDEILRGLIMTPAETTAVAGQYGVLTEDDKAAAARQTEKVAAANEQAFTPPAPSAGAPAPERPVVHCESCGQRIWS